MIDKYLSDDVLGHAVTGEIYYYLWSESGSSKQLTIKSSHPHTPSKESVAASIHLFVNEPQQLHSRDLYRIPAAQSIENLEKYIEQSDLPD